MVKAEKNFIQKVNDIHGRNEILNRKQITQKLSDILVSDRLMKPILFNTEMVKAILEGRKIVTRRLIKPKYSNTHIRWKTDKYGTRLIEIQNDVEGETYGKREDGTTWRKLLWYREIKPPYQVGDVLYVRETYAQIDIDVDSMYFENSGELYRGMYIYKADGVDLSDIGGRWHPSIHMPREAARIFLRVIDVKAEKLQDITVDGALHEGVDISQGFKNFISIWNSTIPEKDIKQYGWDANPYVWVISFERIEKPLEE